MLTDTRHMTLRDLWRRGLDRRGVPLPEGVARRVSEEITARREAREEARRILRLAQAERWGLVPGESKITLSWWGDEESASIEVGSSRGLPTPGSHAARAFAWAALVMKTRHYLPTLTKGRAVAILGVDAAERAEWIFPTYPAVACSEFYGHAFLTEMTGD